MANDTVINGNTTTWTFVSGVSAKVEVVTQKSMTSDASGVELVNDAAIPGASKYYGTDSGGSKGFFDLPSPGSGITVEEEDGVPTVVGVTTIKVTNGTLTDDGGGTVSIATGGGGGSGSTKAIIKTADESRTSTTPTADSELVLAIGVNESWTYTAALLVEGGSTKVTFTVPTGAVGTYFDILLQAPIAFGSVDTILGSDTGGDITYFSLSVINGANSGNVSVAWASSDGSSRTMHKYSNFSGIKV